MYDGFEGETVNGEFKLPESTDYVDGITYYSDSKIEAKVNGNDLETSTVSDENLKNTLTTKIVSGNSLESVVQLKLNCALVCELIGSIHNMISTNDPYSHDFANDVIRFILDMGGMGSMAGLIANLTGNTARLLVNHLLPLPYYYT